MARYRAIRAMLKYFIGAVLRHTTGKDCSSINITIVQEPLVWTSPTTFRSVTEIPAYGNSLKGGCRALPGHSTVDPKENLRSLRSHSSQ
ncbi:hypothetical protein J6590_077964 [Homalodisca vitripennis]|nr:hypothetical protein J6590_077964 [Homalodisca vitripennis]